MIKREKTFSGSTDISISNREIENKKLARIAAYEGMVLLKNNNILPVSTETPIAIFGSGASSTIKGGTGSGDVNERSVVSLYDGLLSGGYKIASNNWVEEYKKRYINSRNEWKQKIMNKVDEEGDGTFWQHYTSNAYEMPDGPVINEEDIKGANVVFYVISRVAGEDADRFLKAGDYYLTDKEKLDLKSIEKYCENIVVVINSGGQVDLSYIINNPKIKGIMTISQPGMEGGNAFFDIVSGKISPSGKLTDTWAKKYEDFPNAKEFSYLDNKLKIEEYKEGIYVGYRYFDSFNILPEFCFGHGLSYTNFSIELKEVNCIENMVCIKVDITNTGNIYSGKEVIQVYVSSPVNIKENILKECKKLCGFVKTKELKPNEKQTCIINIDSKNMAYYSESKASWMLDKGDYILWIGNSSKNVKKSCILQIEEDVELEKLSNICSPKNKIKEFFPQSKKIVEAKGVEEKEIKAVKIIKFNPKGNTYKNQNTIKLDKKKYYDTAKTVVDKLTEDELIQMVKGEISKTSEASLGSSGITVPGAAGESSNILDNKYNIPGVVMADGPAGLRLIKSYDVDVDKNKILSPGLYAGLEGGFFTKKPEYKDSVSYYQYCTAFPVGTLLAQSWNMDLLEAVGNAVAKEMEEFNVSLWLAPGMNIHRNPLCGRNFEYYSEDPLLTGKCGAAITRGVQKNNGVGTTIKHFACNNQEQARYYSDSRISERALREIYLRGFEIAVKESQPMAIMTSYNMINGVHAANSFDLCTKVARDEWGFKGIIMTDWTTTMFDHESIPYKCIEAGNDLIMPGDENDIKNIKKALETGKLKLEDLKECVTRLISIIYQTREFEDCKSYLED